jgi:xylulokinase
VGSGGLFLGLDVGTQGTKGLVVDLDRQSVVARASRSYGLLPGLPSGAAEQWPETWMEAVRAVVRECLGRPGVDAARVQGLGVSGQQHGLVALDADERVIRPAKLWCDTSTWREAEELSARWGRALPVGYTASKILWLARHEPEGFARFCWVLLPHDYVNLRLTGRRTMEAGDASGTGFFDPVRRAFVEAEAAAIDPRLPAMLPGLLAPDEPAGELTRAAAEELGLRPGVLVSAGGGDNMLSAIGSGVVRAGRAALSLGTSATIFAYSAEPVIDPAGLIAPFCDSTGAWLPLLCVMNATGVPAEVARAFSGDERTDWERWSEAAAHVPIGSQGLLFLPYLAGERVPALPSASGTLFGLCAGNLRPANLFRAALEGVALNLGWGLARMRALGVAPQSLRVVGGGAANALWCRILADALELVLEPLAEPESAALGAALQAAWTGTRARGERLELEELCASFVRPAREPIEPEPAAAEGYRGLAPRLRAARDDRHGAGAPGAGLPGRPGG